MNKYLLIALSLKLLCVAPQVSAMVNDEIDLKLRQAAHAGNKSLVEELLKTGECTPNAAQFGINAKTNLPGSEKTALHFAYAGDHIEIADILISKGWDKDKVDANGCTPLQLLWEFRHKVFSKIVLSRFNLMNLRVILSNLNGTKKIKILSLACGFASEFPAIEEVLKDMEYEYVGVDLAKHYDFNFERVIKSNRFTFIKADLTKKETVAQLQKRGPFDVVVLLHPDIFNQPAVFMRICADVPRFLSEKGVFILSTYFLEECVLIHKAFQDNDDELKRIVECSGDNEATEARFCNINGMYLLNTSMNEDEIEKLCFGK